MPALWRGLSQCLLRILPSQGSVYRSSWQVTSWLKRFLDLWLLLHGASPNSANPGLKQISGTLSSCL